MATYIMANSKKANNKKSFYAGFEAIQEVYQTLVTG
jgi:hypothetical protein